MGDANASVPTPQPVFTKPMFGSCSQAGSSISIAFLSQADIEFSIRMIEKQPEDRLETFVSCSARIFRIFHSETQHICLHICMCQMV